MRFVSVFVNRTHYYMWAILALDCGRIRVKANFCSKFEISHQHPESRVVTRPFETVCGLSV